MTYCFVPTVLKKMLCLNASSTSNNRQNRMGGENKLFNFVQVATSLYTLQDPNAILPLGSAKSDLFTLLMFLQSDLDYNIHPIQRVTSSHSKEVRKEPSMLIQRVGHL